MPAVAEVSAAVQPASRVSMMLMVYRDILQLLPLAAEKLRIAATFARGNLLPQGNQIVKQDSHPVWLSDMCTILPNTPRFVVRCCHFKAPAPERHLQPSSCNPPKNPLQGVQGRGEGGNADVRPCTWSNLTGLGCLASYSGCRRPPNNHDIGISVMISSNSENLLLKAEITWILCILLSHMQKSYRGAKTIFWVSQG